MSFLFATETEIGYDTTIHRVTHDNKTCYVYTMGTEGQPRYYRTNRLLFTPRVLCITGRKTRVWEAVEVEGYEGDKVAKTKGSGTPVALKEGWLDEGARTEGEIQAKIFKCLESIQESAYCEWAPDELRGILNDAFTNHKYKEYFMEVTDSTKHTKTKSRAAAAKPEPSILSPPPLAIANPRFMDKESTESRDRSGLPVSDQPGTPQKPKKPLPPRQYRAKQQHRLIYRDVGRSLHDVTNLSTSFLAIKHTFIGVFAHL